MLHYIKWELINNKEEVLIKNDFFWIKWIYYWSKIKWSFLLYPFIDTNHNTIYYAIFDNQEQLDIFNRLLKITWIWVKTADYISTSFWLNEIRNAIDNAQVDFFTKVPWIWKKTAKKIILELKDKLSLKEFEDFDKKIEIKNNIIETLVNLWYSKQKVEKAIKNYKWNYDNTKEIMQEIIKKL